MEDLPRQFTIRESSHRIHNPLTPGKLAALGAALRLPLGTRVLDLACGSGELLCTWARDHGFTGTGVDISSIFIDSARLHAKELSVEDKVRFVHGDASGYVAREPVELAACVGATWIGGTWASVAAARNGPLTSASDMPLPPLTGGSCHRRIAYTYCRYMQSIVLKHLVLSRETPALVRRCCIPHALMPVTACWAEPA
jgi:SAM-dependent methyltransferase